MKTPKAPAHRSSRFLPGIRSVAQSTRKLLAAGTTLLLVASAVVLGVAVPASASEDCVPQAAWTETIIDQAAVPAVTHTEYQRYSWTKPQNQEADNPQTTPPGPDWQANTDNYAGAGHGTDPIGVAFDTGTPGNGNWFFWTATEVVDTAAVAEVSHTVEHPEVTCDAPPASSCSSADVDWHNADYSDVSWEIHLGQQIATRNAAATIVPASYGGIQSIVGFDSSLGNGDNMYVHYPEDVGATNTYTFNDGTVLVASVSEGAEACAPAISWVTTGAAPVTVEQCATATDGGVATNQDANGWTFAETRATGHNEFIAGGLHVWTESNTSTDKAAGYKAVDFALKNVGSNLGIDLTVNSGTILPALQIVLEGGQILVYEPGAYGNLNVWSNQVVPGLSAKWGYPSGGSINAILAADPDIRVAAIGYSLGSGVHGDYTITSITVGCAIYTFDYVAPAAAVCVGSGDWYTEDDDAAPVATADGLRFDGGSGKAVGYRVPATGNLQGWTSTSYDATGTLSKFYYRIVIDPHAGDINGDAIDNWKDHYVSLTVTSGQPVDGSSVAYSNRLGTSKTLDEFAALWPENQIASVGFHLDSGAGADASVMLKSVTSDCGSVDFVPEPPTAVCTADGTTGNISADGTDVWWEIHFGRDAATQNEPALFDVDSYGGFDHAEGYDDKPIKHMAAGNIYVHMPANSVPGNNTETWYFKDGTTVVFTVSGDICNPTMTWVYNLPVPATAVLPTVAAGTEVCVAGQSQDANGSVTLAPFVGGHWELGGVTVSGTVSNLAPGSYAFKAIADTGHVMAGKWWFTMTVPASSDVDCTVPLPVTPTWTDPCGVDNGFWTVPADGNGISWSVVDHTAMNGKVGIVATLTTPGYTFPSGATFKQWTRIQDNTLCVVEVVVVAPVAVDPSCEAADDQGDFSVANKEVSGYIELDLQSPLHYAIDGVPTSSEKNDVAPGEHTITVLVDDDFTLVGPASWTLTVNEVHCDLPTHALLRTSASRSDNTCSASGSYTLADTAGVQWFVNGSATPTAAGTYLVSGATTVTVEARLIDAVNDGWDFDAQTAWTFNFTDPADCLPTLAFTGTDSALFGGLLASGFLATGGVLLALRIRMRRAAE